MQETNTATENVENPDPDDGDRQVTKSTSWHQINLAYPDQTMVHQQDLGQFDTGSVTGYFLETSQTAVLSIPTFDFEYRAIDTFSRVIADFLGNATLRNAKHVVIDLQQNTGGQVGAAIYLFKQVST
jgi:C-terminal processing protease CtpA/Prc